MDSTDVLYSSIGFDNRLFKQELRTLSAHVGGLEMVGLMTPNMAESIRQALADLESQWPHATPDPTGFEDIHGYIEHLLAKIVGSDVVARIQSGKARNDASVTSLKLWLRGQYRKTGTRLAALAEAFVDLAGRESRAIMPGYTHGQVAQPIVFSHYCLAYAQMIRRDLSKLLDFARHMDECPLGSGAIAGTLLPLDRGHVARALGFSRPTPNTLDAVSDRDFVCDACYLFSTIMVHLSRFSEEMIQWSSPEFAMVVLPDRLVTGSSFLPHKRNPDALELVRGKSARAISNLNRVLVLLRTLTQGYSRDMQEDKEALFDSCDTVDACLEVVTNCVEGMRIIPEMMRRMVADPRYLSADMVDDTILTRGVTKTEAITLVKSDLSNTTNSKDESSVELEDLVGRRDVEGGTSVRAIERGIFCTRTDLRELVAALNGLPE